LNTFIYLNFAFSNLIISCPEIILISEGNSLGKDLYEYNDADKLNKIRNSLNNGFWYNPLDYFKLKNLNKKYGLVEEYNL